MDLVHRYLLVPLRPVVGTVLPKHAMMHTLHCYAKQRYLNYLKKAVSEDWFVPLNDDGPAMSRRLRLLTRSLDEKSYEAKYTDDQYFYEGYRKAYHFFKLLEPFGFNLRRCGSILDFGCGSAPVLRLYRYIEGLRLVGTDANPECADWCEENIPGCEFYKNQLTPPLPFSAPNAFDLIISLSVFTHIPLEQQTVWLEELKRVLRPGGFLLCTVAGLFHVDAQLGADGRQLLRGKREISLDRTDRNASLSTRAGGSGYDVFQRRDRVIEVFGSVMKLLDYVSYTRAPIGQDLLILQKT